MIKNIILLTWDYFLFKNYKNISDHNINNLNWQPCISTVCWLSMSVGITLDTLKSLRFISNFTICCIIILYLRRNLWCSFVRILHSTMHAHEPTMHAHEPTMLAHEPTMHAHEPIMHVHEPTKFDWKQC